jgi:hypothetical protein
MTIMTEFDLYDRSFGLSTNTVMQRDTVSNWIDSGFVELVGGINTKDTIICKKYRLTELGKAKLMMDEL